MQCKACGTNIRLGARYCITCGLALGGKSGICPDCHSPVKYGAPFCRHCGKKLGNLCSRCQRINRITVKYCVHCGSKMSGSLSEHPYGTGKLKPGFILGDDYQIVAKIAQGGMSAVYEVRQHGLTGDEQRLAMKEMSFTALQALKKDHQKIVIDGFRREFQLLSQLSHPNLVRAYDYFEYRDRQYYIMEFLQGQTLETILEAIPADEFIAVDRVLNWAQQVCAVLSYLHSQSPPVIYRDLKPSNIMEISGGSKIKLFDFGIARFYKPGQDYDTLRFGTDGYLAPEVLARQSQTNQQTDVYSFGVLIHQLLTGFDPQIDPFNIRPVRTINSLVPNSVAVAIDRAMNPDPTRRTATVHELLFDLFGSGDDLPLPDTMKVPTN